jgi:hypothetical protein
MTCFNNFSAPHLAKDPLGEGEGVGGAENEDSVGEGSVELPALATVS